MKIAIPVYNGNVSNVFDFANRLLILEFADGKEANRIEIDLDKSLPKRADQLESQGIDVLLCGAVSQLLANMVEASGIEIMPYITGNVETVIDAYKTGKLKNAEFSMPGCWLGIRKGFGRRQGCRWRGGRNKK
jgi:predicted Fe-Mo cluster-binding NifX family protein